MANNIQNVGFASPGYDYSAELSEIERKKKLADALQAQSMEPMQQQTAGGYVVPIHPLQGMAKLAQAYVGGEAYKKSQADQTALSQKAQNDYKAMLTSGLNKLQGSPVSEDASGNVTPAQGPDPMGALAAFGSHPMGAQFAPLAMQEMQRQRLAQALNGGAQPTATAQGTPGASAGVGASGVPAVTPQGQPTGGPAGGLPMAVWLQTDPTGQKYLEQLAKDHTEGQKPVVNRGYGIGRMVNGVYVPDQASTEQALKMERGKTEIHAPLEAPVTLKTSSGQEVQLSRPEYAEFQKSGQLPARLGGTPAASPSVVPGATTAQARPASAAPSQAGIGTVGLTQTEPEKIRQAGQQAANTEAGKEFISEMRQNYAKLRDVPATLENIERAKSLASGQAAAFMGPFGESRLAITKFMRSNLPGMGDLKTDSVTSAEELQSTLFNQVMDNLKKMDASPSQYQQQVMQEAFGTLRTDPQSVPKILDVFADILRNRVGLHNDTVGSAEKRGTTFPYDVKVNLPKAGGGLQLSPATMEFMKKNGIRLP